MAESGCLTGWLRKLLDVVAAPAKRRAVYRLVPSLLTPAELAFYRTLQRCIPSGQPLFAKVRLADILDVAIKRSENPSQYQSDLNRITCKHVDFVICEINTLRPILIIELDDRTHQRADRAERDRFLDRACEDAGLPVLHVRNGAYNVQSLTQRIKDAVPGPQFTDQPQPRQDSGANYRGE